MSKQKIKIKVIEKYRLSDMDKRKEALEKILYKLIKHAENNKGI